VGGDQRGRELCHQRTGWDLSGDTRRAPRSGCGQGPAGYRDRRGWATDALRHPPRPRRALGKGAQWTCGQVERLVRCNTYCMSFCAL